MPLTSPKSKLNLKETTSERARREEKAYRKAAKARRKSVKHGGSPSDYIDHSSSDRRRRHHEREDSRSPGPRPPSSRLFDEDARYEAERFEQKLRDLAAQDEGRYAEFDLWENGGDDRTGLGWGDEPYAGTIPKRWREREGNVWNEPGEELGGLDDDSYAETIRQGMYRRKNASSIAHAERLAAEAEATAARLAASKAAAEKLEAKRIAALAAQRSAKHEKAFKEERVAFEQAWAKLLATAGGGDDSAEGRLKFRSIPWPVHQIDGQEVKGSDLTKGRVGAFLLPADELMGLGVEEGAKKRKEVLREAIKRYHPDKFGRHIERVAEKHGERGRVKEAVAQVSRVLMELMAER